MKVKKTKPRKVSLNKTCRLFDENTEPKVIPELKKLMETPSIFEQSLFDRIKALIKNIFNKDLVKIPLNESRGTYVCSPISVKPPPVRKIKKKRNK